MLCLSYSCHAVCQPRFFQRARVTPSPQDVALSPTDLLRPEHVTFAHIVHPSLSRFVAGFSNVDPFPKCRVFPSAKKAACVGNVAKSAACTSVVYADALFAIEFGLAEDPANHWLREERVHSGDTATPRKVASLPYGRAHGVFLRLGLLTIPIL